MMKLSLESFRDKTCKKYQEIGFQLGSFPGFVSEGCIFQNLQYIHVLVASSEIYLALRAHCYAPNMYLMLIFSCNFLYYLKIFFYKFTQ